VTSDDSQIDRKKRRREAETHERGDHSERRSRGIQGATGNGHETEHGHGAERGEQTKTNGEHERRKGAQRGDGGGAQA